MRAQRAEFGGRTFSQREQKVTSSEAEPVVEKSDQGSELNRVSKRE